MKKIVSVLISLIMILSLAACNSSKDTNQGNKNDTNITDSTNNQGKDNNNTSNNAGQDIKIGVKLPDKYPSNILPVYEGSYIVNVIELEGSYTITAFSKDEVSKVKSFYENVLKGASVINETKTEDSLTSFGSKDKYTYQLDVAKSSEMEGYKTSIAIMIYPEKK